MKINKILKINNIIYISSLIIVIIINLVLKDNFLLFYIIIVAITTLNACLLLLNKYLINKNIKATLIMKILIFIISLPVITVLMLSNGNIVEVFKK